MRPDRNIKRTILSALATRLFLLIGFFAFSGSAISCPLPLRSITTEWVVSPVREDHSVSYCTIPTPSADDDMIHYLSRMEINNALRGYNLAANIEFYTNLKTCLSFSTARFSEVQFLHHCSDSEPLS